MWSTSIFVRLRTTVFAVFQQQHRNVSTQAERQTVYVAFGSNIGNRAQNISLALRKLRSIGVVTKTSFLYESLPMYKTDQPNFFNGVIQLSTHYDPAQLLHGLKRIEVELGRDQHAERNGPRPIDLDIVLYGTSVIDDKTNSLKIPHPRLAERQFVLQPLVDIDPDIAIPAQTQLGQFETANTLLQALQRREGDANLACITPLPVNRGVLRWGERTLLMGVLNVTPDSFSDGGRFNHIDCALQQAEAFAANNFDVIDIGGQSTRPGAALVSVDEELRRVMPVLNKVRKAFPQCAVSVDTFYARVARETVAEGADIVNDVTGGEFDNGMYDAVAETGAATVLMHMRGTPTTMRSLTAYEGDDVTRVAAGELSKRIKAAYTAGVARWSIIADGGIGFAKKPTQSVRLIAQSRIFKNAVGNLPYLLGLSRKSWMKGIVGDDNESRDWGTAGAVATAITTGGVDMVRVHNPRVANAVRACDSVRAHAY